MNTTILIYILIALVVLLGSYLVVDKIKGKKKQVNDVLVIKQPMEFSKKILYVTFFIALVIVLYSMFIVYMMVVGGYMGDVSVLNTLLVGLFAEITAGTSFYYWKAKAENVKKIEAITTLEEENL